ncbi:MAG: CocE/NonD family hydrolase [Gammaproteobacteria bacterium]
MKRTLALLFALLHEPAFAEIAGQGEIVIEKNVEARMRDGTVLRADVYRMRDAARRPALLQRTPYSKNPGQQDSVYHRLARAGFVVVVQDTRGRYTSEGIAVPHDEGADGHDSIEWAATLPWVDSRVGTFGGSYSATTQLLAAPLQPPHLAALFPSASYASRHDMVFQGGAFYLADGLSWNLGQAMDTRRRALDPGADRDREIWLDAAQRESLEQEWIRALPLATVGEFSEVEQLLRRYSPGYFDLLAHPARDAWWDRFDVAARHARFSVPAYHLTGWYDSLLNGTLRNFAGLRNAAQDARARRNQRLVVGPWTHAHPTRESTRIGEVDFGPEAGLDTDALMIDWFRHWMPPGNAAADAQQADFPGAPVRIFVMGENRWRDEQEWPLARARITAFHLASSGRANTLNGDGRLESAPCAACASDTYRYDPADPVPTGPSGAYSRAPLDMRTLEQREDVLVYSSAVLEDAVEVTGPVTLLLWAASSAPDTDFTARLVDVFPDGSARALTDGILRARYRNGPATAQPLTPDEVVELRIELGATSNLFLPGHRIRLEVSSSNFPRYDRNPNTGEPFATGARIEVARQTVFHDTVRPSRLLLPVIPR